MSNHFESVAARTPASVETRGTDPFGGRAVELSGDGAARGAVHGEELRSLIADTLERWRQRMAERGDGDPRRYVTAFLGSTGFARTVAELSPDLHAEVEAIAAASNQPRDDVLAYNLMDEEWRFVRSADTGCSVVGTVAEPGGNIVLGQNMDLPEWMQGSQALLRISAGDGHPEQILLTSAGMIGLLGVNAAGLACCVNTLSMLATRTSGMPVAFIVRELLQRRDTASAERYLMSVPHASGQHYAIADPRGLRGYECSADGCVPGPAESSLVHTNHPIWSTPGFSPADLPADTTTYVRLHALAAGLEEIRASGRVEGVLSSTARGVCIPPDSPRPSATFCSAEFTMASPPAVRVALGSPDTTSWRPVPWIDDTPAAGSGSHAGDSTVVTHGCPGRSLP